MRTPAPTGRYNVTDHMAKAEVEVKRDTATKADSGKVDVTLIDPWFRAEMARVLAFGEAKYGKANYRHGEGLDIARLLAAAQRHIAEIEIGRLFDDETGMLHTAHAACCLMMVDTLIRTKGRHQVLNSLPFFEVPTGNSEVAQNNEQDKSSW